MSLESLSALLDVMAAFSGLPQEIRQRIASLLQEQRLATGHVLAAEGQEGDELFLVVEGTIELTKLQTDGEVTVELGRVGPGTLLGGVFTGHPRGAIMTAAEPTVVASLLRVAFDSLCLEFPQEMESVVAWLRQQLHIYQIKAAINESPLFRNLNAEAKSQLEHSFQWIGLIAGETLFREGDSGDALYLIVSGRIRLLHARNLVEGNGNSSAPQDRQWLAELGKGEVFGEMALLTREPRSATAYAVRDTQLARLDRASFDRIIHAFPMEMLNVFIHQMAERLREQNIGRNPRNSSAVSAVVLMQSPMAASFAGQLAKALSVFGSTLHLTRGSLPALSGTPVAVDASESRLVSWLNDQESSHQHLVYEADAIEDAWTLRCLRQADILFAAVDAEDDPRALAARLLLLRQQTGHKIATNLLLFHSDHSAFPKDTKKWLDAIDVHRHWHVQAGCYDDAARIARFLTGRSVGLTLGGGFAFGLAHIGVIQAMRDLNIPIDHVGGTSMGAIIGAGCALHFSRELMLEVMDKGCAQSLKGDYTLPIVSLLKGKKVAGAMGAYIENTDIEDFWLPYFAISASLVHARMVTHTTGSALRSILASCRVPGIFPPLGWDGDVLVDGGVVNNLPCDVMRAKVGSGMVIAVDVSPETDFSVTEQFGMHLSGWRVAKHRANPFSRQQKSATTTIAGILARLVRFGGVAHLKHIRSAADLYLQPPMERFNFRDFSRGEEMSQLAYEFTLAEMERWTSLHGQPWAGDTQDQRDPTHLPDSLDV